MPRDHLYYSCDSHFVEAPEVFEGLEEKFGERAPLIVQDPPGREGIYVVYPQAKVPIPVGRFGIAGARLDLGWEPVFKYMKTLGQNPDSTGQDQCAVIKRQLQLLLPGVVIFLDIAALRIRREA